MITYDMIEKGYDQGIIELVQGYFSKTVCRIDVCCLYFGGKIVEELTPKQTVENIPKTSIISSIFETLESFRKNDTGDYETYVYAHCEAYLKENLK